MKFLVKNLNLINISVSMEIKEEGIRWIFRNRGIHVARRARWARLFQLPQSSRIGIYSEAQKSTIVAYLIIIKAQACFIHEAREDKSTNSCYYEKLFGFRGYLETKKQISFDC